MRNFYFTLIVCLTASISLLGCKKPETHLAEYSRKDGNFSAILMPIAEKDITEFEKSSNEIPHLNFKARAVRGDKIALKIVFSGMGLTDDMHGNVTFDLKVLAPDGSVYPGADVKDVSALEGKVLAPLNVYSSPATMVLRFEPQDQLGIYNVTTTVRDNIAKREVFLKHDIELVETR